MKNTLLLLTFFTVGAAFSQQYTSIPDQKFEQILIDSGLDTAVDGQVLTANIASIAYLGVSNSEIQDLSGIEDFKGLKSLDCSDNKLTVLDISKNKGLKYLVCSNNELTGLDITKNTSLKFLNCDNNNISNIDVSKNKALVKFSSNSNKKISSTVSFETRTETISSVENRIH
jgi:Leucine-rich repeat (LRR) protein